MSALNLSELDLHQKTVAGRVVIQVVQDLRANLDHGVVLDGAALNEYERVKLSSLKLTEPASTPRHLEQPEGSTR